MKSKWVPDIFRIYLAIPFIELKCELFNYCYEMRLRHYFAISLRIIKWKFEFVIGRKDFY